MAEIQDNDEFFELKLNFASQVIHKLVEIEQLILKLESENDSAVLKSISRQLLSEFHSIKGSSGALVFESIKIICHKVEDIVLTDGILGLNNKVELLLTYTDAIKNYFETFIHFKAVDEDNFIQNHKNIFENIIIKKDESDKPKIQHISLNVLAVGLPPLLMKNLLKSASGFDLHISYASNSVNALERISKEKYQFVLSSYFMEPLNGVSLCAAIKLQWPKSEMKFILFPSQNVDLPFAANFGSICPDKIILKDQDMYSDFAKYLGDIFKRSHQIKKIAFLDDDKNILELYKMTFDSLDEVEKLYIDPDSNIKEELINFKPDLIISDVNMPNVEVLNLLKLFTDKGRDSIDFIFITGDLSGPYCKKLLDSGAIAIFDKSSITEDLIEKCEALGYQFRIK